MSSPAIPDAANAPAWRCPDAHGIRGCHPSIVAIVFSRADTHHLAHSLRSLYAQTRELDVVVAHLGDDDAPEWICDEFPDVRLVTPSAAAGSAAVVEAIVSELPADGYLFQEATDWSTPDRLERLLATAANCGADVVGSAYVTVDMAIPDARPCPMPLDANTAFQKGIGMSVVEPRTMLIDARFLDALGGFDTALPMAAGDEFVARAAARGCVANVGRPLCFHRPCDADDWSAASAAGSVTGRVVAAALGERSRHEAVALARRHPHVTTEPGPGPKLVLHHIGTTTAPQQRHRATWTQPPHLAARDGDGDAEPSQLLDAPVFVVSAFESLSRFVACALGQHTHLLAADVTAWMTQIGTTSARFITAESNDDLDGGRTTPAAGEAVYRAGRAAVDRLVAHGPYGGGDSRMGPGVHRWIGSVPAEPRALLSAALLYPEATFVHVSQPVDDGVAAQIEVSQRFDVEELYAAWLESTNVILDLAEHVDGVRIRRMRYDDVVRRPDEVLRSFLESLGEGDDPACAELFNAGVDASAPRRRPPIATVAGMAPQRAARRLSAALHGGHALTTPRHQASTSSATKLLAMPAPVSNRRRRVGDIKEDDRNPYSSSHDLVRRHAPVGATVCVVSRGDEMAVRIRQHSIGWHFPQTEDGAYAGHHPTDASEAIAHLEHLRDRGAELLLIPKPSLWWLNHYTELRLHLTATYFTVPSSADEGVLFDLRTSPDGSPAASR